MIHKKLGMDKDYLATKAIPFLFPLAVEPGLNLSQVILIGNLNPKIYETVKKQKYVQQLSRKHRKSVNMQSLVDAGK